MSDAKSDIKARRHVIKSLRAESDSKRSFSEKMADWITATVGSMGFLLVNVVWFAVWIVLNIEIVPGVVPFDPFPFGLLTMIVSLEAIMLAIFVLISQNRAARVDELREEVDLQVDMIAEEELTKLLEMVSLLLEKQGINTADDEELQAMIAPTNVEKLEQALEEQIAHKVAEQTRNE